MKLDIDVPNVTECSVSKCAYNMGKKCHAVAITVGDTTHPMCDTFFESERHSTSQNMAGIGACKVSICKHNTDFQCSAESIRVDSRGAAAACVTFSARAGASMGADVVA